MNLLSALRRGIIPALVIALVFPGFAHGLASDETSHLIVETPRFSYIPRDVRQQASVRPLGRREGLERWYSIEVPVHDASEILEKLQQTEGIVSARYEHIYRTAAIPNDTHFTNQYGLLSSTTPLADINAPAAWDTTTGSSSIIIAIVDGGVDLQHEDLQEKIWINAGEIQGNGIDDDGNGYVDDVHGWDFVANAPAEVAIDHGTHVAGIAAGQGNNGKGIAGVDWGARILPVRVLSSFGAGREETIINGITYAVDNGADVINLSIAGSASDAMQAAIRYAYESGVVVVAAAGNSGANTSAYSIFPACADDGRNIVLGVGATDSEAEPANFSNFGSCVDVSAPGDDIFSAKANDRYGEMSGTSMSAPFVAGVAGLYLSLHPDASPAEVISAIKNSKTSFVGEDADEWNKRYAGMLNAAAVVGASSPDTSNADTNSSSDDNGGSNESSGDEGSGDSGGDSGGEGGGGDSGGGGSDSSESTPKAKPKVLGVKKVPPNLSLLPKVNMAFRAVFDRNPNQTEHKYWYGRIKNGDKRTYEALLGAMRYQAAHGRTYVPNTPAKTIASPGTSKDLVSQINSLHRTAFGRNPSVTEHAYWMSRVVSGEKTNTTALLGAMVFHRLAGILH